MRTTSATPGSPARFSVAANRSMSPLSPMIVRDSPRLTNASPPASRTTLTTWSTSDAVASSAITTTISALQSPGRRLCFRLASARPASPCFSLVA